MQPLVLSREPIDTAIMDAFCPVQRPDARTVLLDNLGAATWATLDVNIEEDATQLADRLENRVSDL
jgi:hypothetical protein